MGNINRKNNKYHAKKVIFAVILSLAVCVIMSSCGFINAVYEVNEKYGEDNVAFESEDLTVSGKKEDVNNNTILNVETDAVSDVVIEGADRLTSAGYPYNKISNVYYTVADSVVEITTETVQTSVWMGQYVSTGAGSGVIIDDSGLIVTNNHVIENANNVLVRLTDGSEYEATLIGTDSAADLAVIKINVGSKDLCVASLGCSADLVVGEDVIAIGNPLGSLGGTLTTGIISATERILTINGEEMVLLQTNAAINPGNSGGGLFNMAGQLIGIVNAKAAGEDVEGLGFAIPVDYACTVINDLIEYGYVRGIADHGLTLLDVTSQNLPAAYYRYGITSAGIIVLESKYSSEIKAGDRIIAIDGEEVDSSSEVNRKLKSYSVGEVIVITLEREGRILEKRLTLKEKGPEKVEFRS